MNSKIAIQRAKQALEKQDSNGYANFNNWDYEDAFNKELTDWYRRQDWGTNQRKEQEEESEMIIDDLQVFLTEKKMSISNYEFFSDSVKLPENYRYYNKLVVTCSKDKCLNQNIPSKLVESSNTQEYLSDWNFSPDFDFEQCFHIIIGNKVRVFHNNNFTINSIKLTYFRSPKKISCDIRDMDTEWEVKEDVAELIIDGAIKNLAGNIENITANQLAKERTINNN